MNSNHASGRGFLLCTENPQLGWGFRKAFSFEPVIKTP
ncbi:invasin, partial [Escherichia coli]